MLYIALAQARLSKPLYPPTHPRIHSPMPFKKQGIFLPFQPLRNMERAEYVVKSTIKREPKFNSSPMYMLSPKFILPLATTVPDDVQICATL